MTPTEAIDQAFLQLEFAIKLLDYIELKKLDKNAFDTDTLIILPTRNLRLPDQAFHTYDDLILAAQNNFGITFGFTTIVLDRAFESIGVPRNKKPPTSESELRTLVYMLRCAFAHDLMYPRWEARGDFARVLRFFLPTGPVEVDLASLHGEVFDYTHIGGVEKYWEIKDEVRRIASTPG